MTYQKLNQANYLAILLLEKLDILSPTQDKIDLIELIINQIFIKKEMFLNEKLNEKESACLLLAAKGKTIEETAKFMKTSQESVKLYRKNLKKKLKVYSMAHAVFEGIKYGNLIPKEI